VNENRAQSKANPELKFGPEKVLLKITTRNEAGHPILLSNQYRYGFAGHQSRPLNWEIHPYPRATLRENKSTSYFGDRVDFPEKKSRPNTPGHSIRSIPHFKKKIKSEWIGRNSRPIKN